jgi:hypothetical protein
MHYLINRTANTEQHNNPRITRWNPAYVNYSNFDVIEIIKLDEDLNPDVIMIKVYVIEEYKYLKSVRKGDIISGPKEVINRTYVYYSRNPKAGQLNLEGLDYEPTYIQHEINDEQFQRFIDKALQWHSGIINDETGELVPKEFLLKYNFIPSEQDEELNKA